jgi:(p)ppGpp synthase/HD superfamily hydrolase
MLWTPESARALATFAHAGQTDKVGDDYRIHVVSVAQVATAMFRSGTGRDRNLQPMWNGHRVPTMPPVWASEAMFTRQALEALQMICYLHDLVEDTDITLDNLYHWDCPEPVANGVKLLTRTRTNGDRYYRRIRTHSLAWAAKRADVFHNSHPDRIARIADPATRARLFDKYDHAEVELGDADPVAAE